MVNGRSTIFISKTNRPRGLSFFGREGGQFMPRRNPDGMVEEEHSMFLFGRE